MDNLPISPSKFGVLGDVLCFFTETLNGTSQPAGGQKTNPQSDRRRDCPPQPSQPHILVHLSHKIHLRHHHHNQPVQAVLIPIGSNLHKKLLLTLGKYQLLFGVSLCQTTKAIQQKIASTTGYRVGDIAGV